MTAPRGSRTGAEVERVRANLTGAAVWTIGSGLLAKEPEGDPEHDRVHHNNTRDSDDDNGRGHSGRTLSKR